MGRMFVYVYTFVIFSQEQYRQLNFLYAFVNSNYIIK